MVLCWYHWGRVFGRVFGVVLVTRWCALHRAALHGFVDLCRTLVEDCGADMGITDVNGNTPLHRAFCWNQAGVAAYLLSKGASADQLNLVSHHIDRAGR